MKNIYSFLITFSLFIFIFNSIEPPLWPKWFSQSMTVNFEDLSTTGSYWYDSEIGGERYDFANGNTRTGCGSVHPINTPCTHLIKDGWFFMIYPQKNLCCKLCQAKPIPRNWLQNFTFKGQQQIQGNLFNIWDANFDYFDQLFYIQANEQQRPRRQLYGGRIYFDYWLNSFNNSKPKSDIFVIPTYCQKRCWDQFQTQEQYKKLKLNLMKIHKGLLVNQKFQKFAFKNQ